MNGVINIYKEEGISSFGVVHEVKKILNTRKCGHTGTLDPIAEGVLAVCINEATKLSDYLMAEDKEYIASVRFGLRTDTYDITGNITDRSDYIPGLKEVENICKFVPGDNVYKIPAYSAVKIDGERAYKLARTGEIKDAGERIMTVFSVDILSYTYPDLAIKVYCKKGTYIRSIIDFIGEKLKCFGVMEHLIRTKNGVFESKDALRLHDIKAMADKGDMSFIKPLDKVIGWPKSVLKNEWIDRYLNGMNIPKNGFISLPIEDGDLFWIVDLKDNILGFAKKNKGSNYPLKIIKVFKK